MRMACSNTTRFFFVLTFVVSWLAALPAMAVHFGVFAGPIERFMPLLGLSAFSPTIAAVVASRREGAGATSAMFARFKLWRVPPRWYLVALGLQASSLTVALLIYAGLAGASLETWVYYPNSTQRVIGMLVISFAEEVGWRGFALPRMQRRYGPLSASLRLGVLWALWHVPMFVLSNIPLSLMPVFVVFFAAGSVFFTWLFNHTEGSLLLAYLAHVGAHLNNSHAPLPGNVVPLLLHTGVYVVLACSLVTLDSVAWRRARECASGAG
jgi:uncharacterized protein